MIKMKQCFPTSYYKILYLTFLTICRKNISYNYLMDYKFITIKKEEKVFWVGSLICCQYFEIQ
jgi:hypothetical protein